MEFKKFKDQFQKKFYEIINESSDVKLFISNTNPEDRDKLWDTYINSFPDEVRQGYNCNCCRQFIKWYGGLVWIDKNYNSHSIWEFDCDEPFKSVVNKLDLLVKSSTITSKFYSDNKKAGTDFNYDSSDPNNIIKWEHLYFELPKSYLVRLGYNKSIQSLMGLSKSTKDVFKRALSEISESSIDIVLDLINQGSLYRGDQYKLQITKLLSLKKEYDKLSSEEKKDNYCWINYDNSGISNIRNSAIGTLLIDLTEGKDLDHAVTAYERITAPENYKRTKTLVTKSMIESAAKQVDALGLTNSLARRHAVKDDITVNDVIFVDRSISKAASNNPFKSIADDMPVSPKKFRKITEVGIDEFISNIIPTATEIEVLFEGRLVKNLMNLTSQVDKESPSLLNWKNGFCWSYNGDVTDSFKAKIAEKGGNVNGDLRCSLHWFNYDDLDIHVIEPNGNEIYYASKISGYTKGQLDIDMNAGSGTSRDAVENIIWKNESDLLEGRYKLVVNNYCLRETRDAGFECEIEYGGVIHKFDSNVSPSNKGDIVVAEFEYKRGIGITIVKSINESEGSTRSTEVWGLDTNKFHKVDMITYSPNYWEGESGNGNKHFFFFLKGLRNPESVRGIYNEFLRSDLHNVRKAFEVLGSKMRIEYSDNQMAGLGFSSTIRESLIVKIKGNFERIIKIKF